jgi:hypothetical protein
MTSNDAPCRTRIAGILAACLLAARLFAASAVSQTIDLTLARQYFQEADTICQRDNGRLWGVSLCGPMLLVDPATRTAVANQSDREGRLTLTSGVYAGKLPQTINLANTATTWAGTKWTMIVWPLPEDRAERGILMTHELWHRIQNDLGLPMSSRRTRISTRRKAGSGCNWSGAR